MGSLGGGVVFCGRGRGRSKFSSGLVLAVVVVGRRERKVGDGGPYSAYIFVDHVRILARFKKGCLCFSFKQSFEAGVWWRIGQILGKIYFEQTQYFA